MRSSRPLRSLLLIAVAAPAAGVAQAQLASADRAAIARLVERASATARRAWETRDPALMIPDSPAIVAHTSQGQAITAADLRADLLRRMTMTTRVDTMTELLDSITATYVRGGPLGWQMVGLHIGPAPAP